LLYGADRRETGTVDWGLETLGGVGYTALDCNIWSIAMKVSAKGLALIKQHEGLVLHAYKDPIGVLTIGYGHTSMAGPPKVYAGQTITKAEAGRILRQDVDKFSAGVLELLEGVDLTQGQFDALVSLAFNVGLGNFQGSTLRKKLLRGDYLGAANEFPKWRKAGGNVLPGLVKRRAQEKALFLGDTAVEDRTPHAEQDKGKPPLKSTTNWSAILQTILTNIGAFAAFDWKTALVIAVPATLLMLWIIHERGRHAEEGMV
jgi:lysozyme